MLNKILEVLIYFSFGCIFTICWYIFTTIPSEDRKKCTTLPKLSIYQKYFKGKHGKSDRN